MDVKIHVTDRKGLDKIISGQTDMHLNVIEILKVNEYNCYLFATFTKTSIDLIFFPGRFFLSFNCSTSLSWKSISSFVVSL